MECLERLGTVDVGRPHGASTPCTRHILSGPGHRLTTICCGSGKLSLDRGPRGGNHTEGGDDGPPSHLPTTCSGPESGMPPTPCREELAIQNIPEGLNDLLGEMFPGVLWLTAEQKGPGCFVIWMLDLDYRYNEWLATCSFDGRWTLSPRGGPCYDSVTTPLDDDKGTTWRGIRSRHRRR